MGCGIDEVAESRDGCRQTNSRAIESANEDLGVRVEGACDVDVVGDKLAQPVSAEIATFRTGTRDGYISAASTTSIFDTVTTTVIILVKAYAEKNRPLPVKMVIYRSSLAPTSLINSDRR